MLKNLMRPVAIVGAGKSGQAARRLLKAAGLKDPEICLFDDKPEKSDFASTQELLTKFQPKTIVVSPGYPLASPWIADFIGGGGVLTSELSLACQLCSGEKIVAVTGSLGKSTTIMLLGEAVRKFSPSAFVGGNIGIPFAEYMADVWEKKRSRAEWVVLELSSYQLENAIGLSCVGSAFTYLSRNHLDRYPSLEAYYGTKWKLAHATKGPIVGNRHGGDLENYAKARSEKMTFVDASTSFLGERLKKARLVGAHNRDNIAVAAELAQQLSWPASAIDAMLSYGGLPHRLENIGEQRSLKFLNDSKATTMESVLTAVDAAGEAQGSGTLWLLLGGRDKKLPWDELASLKGKKKLKAIFFGECAALAQKQSGLEGQSFPKLKSAMAALPMMVKRGDTVLLSPGGSSLDEFSNFEERGDAFKRWVKELFA